MEAAKTGNNEPPGFVESPRVISVERRIPRFDNSKKWLSYDLFTVPDGMQQTVTVTQTPTLRKHIGVIFLHGFGGNRSHLAHHARRIVEQSNVSTGSSTSVNYLYSAVCCELIPLTESGTWREVWIYHDVRSAQVKNIQQITHVISELLSELKWDGYILAGHSAGGAIAFEAATQLLLSNNLKELKTDTLLTTPPIGLLLFDAVPFATTLASFQSLHVGRQNLQQSLLHAFPPICSIRGEPSAWNKQGAMEEVLRCYHSNTHGHLIDLYVRGSRHGDCLQTDSWMFRQLGLFGSPSTREAVHDIAEMFLSNLKLSTAEEFFSTSTSTLCDAISIKKASWNDLVVVTTN